MQITKSRLLLSGLAAAMLTGCAGGPNTAGLGGGDYVRAQARAVQNVEIGQVESVRAVALNAGSEGVQNAIAPVGGALLGGALGSLIGKGDGKKVAMVLGALGGAVGGSAIQKAGNQVKGIEVTVRLDHRIIAVTQADDGTGFRVGDRVRVLNDGRTWRVAPL